MDLIALKRLDSYKLGAEMKKCLVAYASGTVYTPPEFNFKASPKGYVGKFYQFNIELNDKKPEEAAAIEVLNSVRDGYRCAFLKALFRSNALYLPLMIYADDDEVFTSKREAFYQSLKNTKEKEEAKEEPILQDEEEEIPPPTPKKEVRVVDESEFDALFNGLSSLA